MILFLHLLFALCFSYKIYLSRKSYLFSETIIKSCIFGYLFTLILLSQASLKFFLLSIYLPIIIFLIFEWVFLRKERKSFKDQFRILLDSIISRIKMGNSFREALHLSINSMASSKWKEDFNELKDRMVYQQPPLSSLQEYMFVYNIFKKTDQDSQPLSKLYYIRHTLKIESLFHAKVHQALLQIHLQSIILFGLYFPLCSFILIYYGFKYLYLVFLSLFLFSIGALILFLGGKKIQWTL